MAEISDSSHQHSSPPTAEELQRLANDIRRWGAELGFAHIGITDTDVSAHGEHLRAWLAKGFHGEMGFMAEHAELRANPEALLPGSLRVISARMDYLSDSGEHSEAVLADANKAYVARYALGRDYHKLLRKRLANLAKRIGERAGSQFRAFVDSAPVLERGLAEKSGLGWIGKNAMLINPKVGSWFFLGEIYTDIPLPLDPPQETGHCGSCHACLDICPTGAIVAPGQVDARRCISYLTIELKGSIPEALRAPMGNRIFGCDDCQLACPWNKFATLSDEAGFQPRHGLADAELVDLFGWSEEEFLQRSEGSPLRRVGYERWLRNIAVALGNAPRSEAVLAALQARSDHPSALVREHVAWALVQQAKKADEVIARDAGRETLKGSRTSED